MPAEADRPAPIAGLDKDSATAALDLIASLGARRPLVGPDGSIAGFEFRVLSSLQRRANESGQIALQQAHARHVLKSAALAAQGGSMGLARLPPQWLLALDEWPAGPGVCVGLEWSVGPLTPGDEARFAAMLQSLRAQGARVGWDPDGIEDHVPDLVLVQQGQTAMEQVLVRAHHHAQRAGGVPVWVTDVQNIDDLEQALAGGAYCVSGAVGHFRAARSKGDKGAAAPEVLRLGRLMQLLAKGADNQLLAEEIKADVGLSYRLLGLLQSARFAHLGSVVSVESAVQLLGRNELYRWLSVLLMHFARARKASVALREVTLWRARFMELSAQSLTKVPPDELFTLGLASMLGPMLELSVEEVVTTLGLNEASSQALLQNEGPYVGYLALAQHMEQRGSGETGATDGTTSEWMAALGGASAVQSLGDQAWAWVAEHRLA